MLAKNVLRVSSAAARTHPRFLHSSRPSASDGKPGHDSQLSQGHAALDGGKSNKSPQDVQSQQARAGKEAAASSSNPHDAASGAAPRSAGSSGNPEALGFQEQIGGQSAARRGGEAGAREDAQAPGVFSSIKQKLGLGTSADDVKQNQGGGRGVTGTGTARRLHTSAAVRAGASATQGQAPEASRQPKEETHGEQNAHLRHKRAGGAPDAGAGNAGATPRLPSHRVPQTAANAPDTPPSAPHQKRALHTSAVRAARAGDPSADPEQMVGGEDGQGAHSASSYFKDVDAAPSSGAKTHKVDSSSGALDEAPKTGPFSQSGPGEEGADKEYEHVNREAPYDKPTHESGPEQSEKHRYGNVDNGSADKGPATSKPGEGPEGAAAGGRKPEGR